MEFGINEIGNGVLLAGNLVFVFLLVGLCGLYNYLGKGSRLKRGPSATILAGAGSGERGRTAGWFLEFAVYSAGMIRLADLVVQGIGIGQDENRILLGVKLLVAESMIALFVFITLKFSQNTDIIAIDKTGWAGQNGEFVIGMVMLLVLTVQGWKETNLWKGLVWQIVYLAFFFLLEYLRRRRQGKPHDSSEITGDIEENYLENVLAEMGLQGNGFLDKSIPGNGFMGKASKRKGSMESLCLGSMSVQRMREADYLKNVDIQYQRTRELWHDLKNHIRVLEILAKDGKVEELNSYLDSFKRDVESRMIPMKSGSAVVDALLSDKLYRAKRKEFEVSFELCDLSEMTIQAADLCVVLGNLLDNAIEACDKLPEGGRIVLRLKSAEDFYYLTVINTALEPVRKGDGFVSGKKGYDNGVGHGIGLRSVERIAHQYGGSLVTDYQDGEFKVIVRMQNPKVT